MHQGLAPGDADALGLKKIAGSPNRPLRRDALTDCAHPHPTRPVRRRGGPALAMAKGA